MLVFNFGKTKKMKRDTELINKELLCIANAIYRTCNVTLEEMRSASRKNRFSEARGLFVVLARNYTDARNREIATFLGRCTCSISLIGVHFRDYIKFDKHLQHMYQEAADYLNN